MSKYGAWRQYRGGDYGERLIVYFPASRDLDTLIEMAPVDWLHGIDCPLARRLLPPTHHRPAIR